MDNNYSNIIFRLGEVKYVDFELESTNKLDTPVVTLAEWQLFSASGEKLQSGSCEINGNIVSALISPTQRGEHFLALTVSVPPEVLKTEVFLHVD
ncbi:MAG: hypothetical protein IJC39_02430 [Firmicutes bacterium]|nr:hypothetical protein [Bacillota bacterium]